jgi:hypothetical protein
MTKRCTILTGFREWTTEEMMAYLDWSKGEDKRINSLVAKEFQRLDTGRRGMSDI